MLYYFILKLHYFRCVLINTVKKTGEREEREENLSKYPKGDVQTNTFEIEAHKKIEIP